MVTRRGILATLATTALAGGVGAHRDQGPAQLQTQSQTLSLEYRIDEIDGSDVSDAIHVDSGTYRWFAVEAAILGAPDSFSTDPLFGRAFLAADDDLRMAGGLRKPSGEMPNGSPVFLAIDRHDAPDVTLEAGDRITMYYHAPIHPDDDPTLEWDLRELDVIYDVDARRVD